ncbi:MAG: hypothetical protein AAGA30_16645, partial [Planctomycetota bacterium]
LPKKTTHSIVVALAKWFQIIRARVSDCFNELEAVRCWVHHCRIVFLEVSQVLLGVMPKSCHNNQWVSHNQRRSSEKRGAWSDLTCTVNFEDTVEVLVTIERLENLFCGHTLFNKYQRTILELLQMRLSEISRKI